MGKTFKLLIAGLLSLVIAGPIAYALPATSNYELNSYGFGSGGTAGTSTSNYSVEGITGEASGAPTNTTNYAVNPGYIQTQQANIPKVALTNPASYYDKLNFVIDQQNNPSDALYALQVSTTSNFSSGISYVQPDDTLGASLTTTAYQTYTNWGGATGENIIGLAANATYYIRAKATQGKYTESAYGPSSNAATLGQSLSFCLYTNASCGAGGSVEAFSGLVAGTITNSPTNIGINFATNANFGGNVYVYALNGGLKSVSAGNYLLASATANLAAVSEGFGAQIITVSQTTGGPFSKVSPFNLSSNNVGVLSTSIASILSSANPLTGGVGTVQLQVKPDNTTPEATDYSEMLTFIAAASF